MAIIKKKTVGDAISALQQLNRIPMTEGVKFEYTIVGAQSELDIEVLKKPTEERTYTIAVDYDFGRKFETFTFGGYYSQYDSWQKTWEAAKRFALRKLQLMAEAQKKNAAKLKGK